MGAAAGNRTRVVLAALALVVLAAAWAVALHDPPPEWEVSLTRWGNDAPEWAANALWPVMQLGALWAPALAALLVLLVRRDRLLALLVLAAGLTTWLGAKAVKAVVDRGRPASFLPDVTVRDPGTSGAGFLSGHAAVAATTAVMVTAAIPRRHRPAAALVAGLVAALTGIARIVHGVHLPADVVGGWAFGVLVGLAGLGCYDLAARRVIGRDGS